MQRRSFIGASVGAGALAMGCGRGGQTQSTEQNSTAGPRVHPLDGFPRENLKITDVRLRMFSCEIPPEKWWVGSGITLITEVMTDQGISGIGGPSPYSTPEEVKKYTEEYIKPLIIGKNPFDVERFAPGHEDSNVSKSWGAVNTACWDIIGKALNKPLYEILAIDHAPNTRIQHYASAGTLHDWQKRPEDLYDEALSYKEEGFTHFKFRLGVNFEQEQVSMKRYIPFIRKLRDTVGWDLQLIHENNMRLTLEQCLELAPVLRDLKFLWLEEPINRWNAGAGYGTHGKNPTAGDIRQAIDDHLKIKEALGPDVLVSGGETMTTRYEFKEWIDRGAYDIVQPDCNISGLGETWHIARMAHEMGGKPCIPHNWHGDMTWIANINLVGGIPNYWMLEVCRHYNPFREGLFKEPITIHGSVAELPNRPGLGVELADDIDSRYRYNPDHHWEKTRPAGH